MGGTKAQGNQVAQEYRVISRDEVAKHNKENDCWVVIYDKVFDLTNFYQNHPGGPMVIFAYAGKDATVEFKNTHDAHVLADYVDTYQMGIVDKPKAKPPIYGRGSSVFKSGYSMFSVEKLDVPLLDQDNAEEQPKWALSIFYYCYALLYQVCSTLLSATNFSRNKDGELEFSNDRSGLTKSATFLIFFMIIHSAGNMHFFMGPDDFNGYGYFYERMWWTSIPGFPSALNISIFRFSVVELYLAAAAALHVSVALKRTWDINIIYSINSGKLNLVMSGLVLLTFLCVHLSQFRFATVTMYKLRPPPYLINFQGIPEMTLFWTKDPSVKAIEVRDIYKHEFELFSSPSTVAFYWFCTACFFAHGCWGWAKLVPSSAMNIPKPHQKQVIYLGQCVVGAIAAIYFSFPLYCILMPEKKGWFGEI